MLKGSYFFKYFKLVVGKASPQTSILKFFTLLYSIFVNLSHILFQYQLIGLPELNCYSNLIFYNYISKVNKKKYSYLRFFTYKCVVRICNKLAKIGFNYRLKEYKDNFQLRISSKYSKYI